MKKMIKKGTATIARKCLIAMRRSKFYFVAKKEVFRHIRKIRPNFRKPVAPIGEGTVSARYCYSVFMRHIIYLFQNGMPKIPDSVAEFGPGNSLGAGLCWILMGAKEYYALDLVKYADTTHNLKILEELIILFRQRTPIPNGKEFPEAKPRLDDYSFPSHILGETLINQCLSEKRIALIRNALIGENTSEITINYIVPWECYTGNYPKVELVFSQAVLEHIDNLERFFDIMSNILVPGGLASHQIDFRSHGETYEWNGHWSVSEKKWQKIREARAFVINREPLSSHLRLFEKNGFRIRVKVPFAGIDCGIPTIRREALIGKYVGMSNEDFETSGCFVIAQKA